MKKPKIFSLDNPILCDKALTLDAFGKIAISLNQLIYLDLDDAWIHTLFPLLQGDTLKKPNYFANDGIGAHISVIYPEEKKSIKADELNKLHFFRIKTLVRATLGTKNYYTLLVEAPTLIQLRKNYQLPELLDFKGYGINLHITLATESLLEETN